MRNTALGFASMSHTALGVASKSHTALGFASKSHTALGFASKSHTVEDGCLSGSASGCGAGDKLSCTGFRSARS